jgi:hypothetical protein
MGAGADADLISRLSVMLLILLRVKPWSHRLRPTAIQMR